MTKTGEEPKTWHGWKCYKSEISEFGNNQKKQITGGVRGEHAYTFSTGQLFFWIFNGRYLSNTLFFSYVIVRCFLPDFFLQFSRDHEETKMNFHNRQCASLLSSLIDNRDEY